MHLPALFVMWLSEAMLGQWNVRGVRVCLGSVLLGVGCVSFLVFSVLNF